MSNHEPSEVVYHLKKENLPFRSADGGHSGGGGTPSVGGAGSSTHSPSSLPASIVQHAAFGRWRLGTCPVLSSLPARPTSPSSSSSSSSSSSASAAGSPSSSSVPSARTAHELEHDCTRDSKGPEYENWQEKGRSGGEDEEDSVFIESEGFNPTYMFAMHLSIKSLSSTSSSVKSGVTGTNAGGGGGGGGGGTRNSKLVIKSYWSYNRLMDVWHQFTTTDDTPFFWSRVKSYGFG